MSAPEIARRAGVEREAVRLWQQGLRGPGGFPAPVVRVPPEVHRKPVIEATEAGVSLNRPISAKLP